MKTKTNLVIIISLVIGMLSFANAEVKNYYVNGIDNTLKEARKSSEKIETITGLKMQKPLYNTTQGVARDLGESIRMVTNFDNLYKLLVPIMNTAQLSTDTLKSYAEKYKDETFQEIALKLAKIQALEKLQSNKEYIRDLYSQTQVCTGPGTYLGPDGEVVCTINNSLMPKFEDLGISKIEVETLFVKAGAYQLVEDISSLYSDVYRYLNYENSYENTDLIKASNIVQSEIDKGNKINIVAHSQGNLMANEMFDNYINVTRKDARMYSVATPANKVFGESYGNGYITLHEDIVALGFVGSLPSNYTNHTSSTLNQCSGPGTYLNSDGTPVCTDYTAYNIVKYDDPRGHNLVNVYLKEGTGSRQIIKDAFIANYNELKALDTSKVDYNITLGETRNSSWDLSQLDHSQNEIYNLYVPSCRKVRIDLKSSQVDTFLELVRDDVLIAYDNDSGYGNRARIITDLAEGYYEIYPTIYQDRDNNVPSPLIRADYELVTQDLGEGNCTVRKSDFYVTDAKMVNKNAIAPGANLTVSSYQRYKGNVESKNLPHYPKLAYFLSKDQNLDPDDILLSTDVSSIGSDDLYDNEKEVLTIPTDTKSGKYYILFVANFYPVILETDFSNNIMAVKIDVGEPISDIYIANAKVNTDVLDVGDRLKIYSDISYTGNQTKKFVGPVYTSYYFVDSNNTKTLIGYDYSTIGSDDLFDDEYISFKIPENTAKGKGYILILTDYKDEKKYINEINEDNNLKKIDIWIGEIEPIPM